MGVSVGGGVTVGAGVDAAMKSDPTITASFLGPNEETDIEGQIRIIESAISSKVDAIAVALTHAQRARFAAAVASAR